MTENGKRKPICPYADRAENLERRNEILETGQRVYDIDNKKSKIGDGEKHWNDLPWESTGGGSTITIDTEITDSATDTNVPSTKAVKTELDKKVDTTNAVGHKTVEGGEIFNDYTNNKATAQYAHAEGKQTEASGSYSHAEGQSTIAFGDYSHVEGISTEAAYVSHAEGRMSKAIGSHSHAEGMFTTASGDASHTEGGSTIVGTKAFVVDIANSSSTDKKYKLDSVSGLSTNDIVYLVYESSSSLSKSSAMTIKAVDSTNKTITVNTYTTSTSDVNYIFVEDKPDKGTTIIGNFSSRSHAEGDRTYASGVNSHAEGSSTIASGSASHAEGISTTASGQCAHAEGLQTIASGLRSHTEGYSTTASGANSHAEGHGSMASSDYGTHAEGYYTVATRDSQHVQGKFNRYDTSAYGYAHIVGNGSDSLNRSNAHTLDWDGNAWYAGNVTVGGTYNSETGVVDGAKELATKEYVDTTAVETSVTDPIVVNTIYSLGEQSSLTIELPTGTFGNFIQFDFISGSTATTLSITPTDGLIGNNLDHNANTIYT